MKGLLHTPYFTSLVTVLLLVVMLGLGGAAYPGLLSTQVIFNLLIDNAFLLVIAVGMTFVIVSGGIDLSVGSVLALYVSLPEFEAVLPAAVSWQLTRVLPSGEVDVKGNTRTGVGKEANAFGHAKKVNSTEVIFALTYYGLIHRDQAALDAASRVFDYTHQNPKPKKAPS